MAKPLAKSLHTVTVLVRVARSLALSDKLDDVSALKSAEVILGLDMLPDPYGLRVAALKQMRSK